MTSVTARLNVGSTLTLLTYTPMIDLRTSEKGDKVTLALSIKVTVTGQPPPPANPALGLLDERIKNPPRPVSPDK